MDVPEGLAIGKTISGSNGQQAEYAGGATGRHTKLESAGVPGLELTVESVREWTGESTRESIGALRREPVGESTGALRRESVDESTEEEYIILKEFGWNNDWAGLFEKLAVGSQKPARVCMEQKGLYKLMTEYGEMYGEVSGRFRYEAAGLDAYPAVGDWVAAEMLPSERRAVIHAVLPRKSRFSRKVAGTIIQEQVVASNFDYVFIVNSLNNDFNLRRIERYLTMAWEGGGSPVVVLSKKDLCLDVDEKIRAVQSITFGIPVISISAVTGEGVDELRSFLASGKTVAVLGSSGVGKSTLTNLLAGKEVMETKEIREDDAKGRHTTTFRNLIKLPDGGMVIDTPGMRELQLWDSDNGLQGAFGDIENLGTSCRFRDCSHNSEPGCAVIEAVRNGLLPADRLDSFRKLKKELRFIESKHNQSLRLAERKNARTLSKVIKKYKTEHKGI